MKNNDNRIRQAFEAVTPDVLDSVLRDLDEQKGTGFIMTQNKNNNWVKRISGIAAAVVILAGAGISANAYRVSNTVASTVALDVNPSVEIKVNAKEKVLSVDALNEDGKNIIGDMDFKGSDIDLAVNALIGSMLKNGYLNELTNSILVSVDNNDPEKSAALRQRIADEISVILNNDAFSASVLSQTLTHDAAVDEIASANDISTGKAQLIHQITRQNTFYSADDLAAMSINELNLISMSGGLKLENVSADGTASAKAYIGEEAAKQAALAHAGVEESAITHYEIELDMELGVMVYDVEFDADGIEYDYDIGAENGEVVKYDNKRDDDSPKADSNSGGFTASLVIGEEAAKQAAYTHAGVNAEDVLHVRAELDRERGITIYEVEFRTAEYEYEYDINATTAEVVKYERESEDSVQQLMNYIHEVNGLINEKRQEQTQEILNKADAYFTESEVLLTALTHANVNADAAYDVSVELDKEHGKAVYEVEFKADGYEYEYEIDASTGDVLKFDKELDD